MLRLLPMQLTYRIRAHCWSPNRSNIRSCTTWFATSPPLCSATAPTIAYNVWHRTIGWPDPLRLCTWSGKYQRVIRYVETVHWRKHIDTYIFGFPTKHSIQPISIPKGRHCVDIEHCRHWLLRQLLYTFQRWMLIWRSSVRVLLDGW